ncbi:PAS/PAC sensor hybrid histidine kinase [Thermodesulfatator indicus DSM 15286]|uniref:histidine kinase n=1 Tax=Thermodesulfatator indicus (strain DSM 15286 / JCM 11887 / CIR29812) TaxID=667014 RepID=F8ADX8_THEID|nr:PAS domain-containing sensor histidine kinase [Thermodesulfatator indicus]AEH44943.1 PAS/PAC sensor hybrid histidine kinase [Thermodesulfatator indicus DSM 15286]
MNINKKSILNEITDLFPGFITLVDSSRTVLFANKSLIKWRGYDPTGYPCYKVFHNLENICPDCPLEDLLDEDSPVTWERLSLLDNHWYRIASLPIVLSSGEKALLSIVFDIHDQIAAQKEAERNRRLFEAIWQKAPFIILAIEPKTGEIIFANEKFKKILGYDVRDVIGQKVFDFLVKEEREKARQCCKTLCEGEEKEELEILYFAKDGSKKLLRNTCFKVDLEGSSVILNIAQDITEEKRLAEQLIQAQKMEAVGRLAGGLAHDFNNLITALKNYIELLSLNKENRQKIENIAENIKLVLERTGNITQKLLTFSGKQPQKSGSLNISKFLLEMQDFWQRLLGENIELNINITDDIWAKIDETHLQQIVMNLLINAKDVLPDGGKIEINLERKDFDEHFLKKLDLKGKTYAILSVSDSGPGIPKKYLPYIFEPFFTTKPSGKGTGLGLAMVYSLVKQYQGHISVYTEEGKGTTFKILLPLTENTTHEKSSVEESFVSKEDKKTCSILVVEDDPLVREPVIELLKSAGYQVEAAQDGLEALDILSKTRIDLVLTDLVMPKMGGEALVQKIKASYPHIKVIITSGYPESSVPVNGKLEDVTFISKPYSFSQLLRTVQTILYKNS